MKRLALSFMVLLLLLGTAVLGCTSENEGNGASGAEFRISNLVVTPSEIAVGEEFVITVEVANTGGNQGTYSTVLEINGETAGTKNVAMAAGSKETVSFQLTEDTPGVYTAKLDDLSATFTIGTERIIFQSDRDGEYEIYMMDPDGSNVVQLTDNTAADRDPSWSPNGQQIVFHSDRSGAYEIYVMNADGSNVVQLTDNTATSANPFWALT